MTPAVADPLGRLTLQDPGLNRGVQKVAALDGLRGLAVLGVMGHHFEHLLPGVGILVSIKAFLYFGWAGVDLFFALSGFLITTVLLQSRGAINYFASFYARRAIRILPIYYLTLVAVFFLFARIDLKPSVIPSIPDRPYYFAFLTNWLAVWTGVWPPNILGHFWSLAVEEQFYLIWPVLVLAFRNDSLKKLLLCFAAAEPLARITLVCIGFPAPSINYSTLTHSDGLLLGAYCAIIYAERKSELGLRLNVWILIPLLLFWSGVLAAGKSQLLGFILAVGLTLLAISASALILKLSFADERVSGLQRFVACSGLRRIGRYSYGMYVYHVPLLMIYELVLLGRLPPTLTSSVTFECAGFGLLSVVTFLVAMASFELFERRILSLKKHLEPRFAGPAHA